MKRVLLTIAAIALTASLTSATAIMKISGTVDSITRRTYVIKVGPTLYTIKRTHVSIEDQVRLKRPGDFASFRVPMSGVSKVKVVSSLLKKKRQKNYYKSRKGKKSNRQARPKQSPKTQTPSNGPIPTSY